MVLGREERASAVRAPGKAVVVEEKGRRTRGWFLEFGSRGHLVLVS